MSNNGPKSKVPYWYGLVYEDKDEAETLRRAEDPETQMIVYRSDTNDAIFDEWIQKLEKKIAAIPGSGKAIRILNICGNCNNSLMLLSGQGVKTFVTTEAAPIGGGQNPQPGSTGEELGIYRSANFPIQIPKKLTEPKKATGKKPKLSASKSAKDPVRVAILDTGLKQKDSALKKFLIEPQEEPCIVGAGQGWNFIDDNEKYNDDHKDEHGTTVTRMLLDQSLITPDGNPVEIIPIKVQDGNGKSDLYDVMCALAYAKSMNAQIINASFGYYAPLNAEANGTYCVKTFRKFIKDVLTDNGILLVAAAGNASKPTEIKQLFNPNGISSQAQAKVAKTPDDPRNLDKVHFYPASFAADKEFWNVISVTTVTPKITSVSKTQNFSRKAVDIGVPADIADGNGFSNPRKPGTFIAGSSFATPKVAGMLAGNYDLIAGMRKKEEIISILKGSGLLSPVPSKVAVRRAILKKQNGQTTKK